MDSLAGRFAKAESKEDREKILFAATSWAAEKGEDGEVYVKIMRAALETGKEGVEREKVRVEKLFGNKSSPNVKTKLTKKLNVINSFMRKDEL